MTVIHDDEFCLQLMKNALDALRGNKENVKDPDEARAWAITITEQEKAIAYFETYVVRVGLHSSETNLIAQLEGDQQSVEPTHCPHCATTDNDHPVWCPNNAVDVGRGDKTVKGVYCRNCEAIIEFSEMKPYRKDDDTVDMLCSGCDETLVEGE